ncbi:MAG: hypothetical protein ACNI25_10335 [Halarcobacter sp.]
MNTLELIKKLSLWEDRLNRYKRAFKDNQDIENYEEVKRFLDTIDEFIDMYNTTETKKDEKRYYNSIKYWIKMNENYMQLLENLYKAYEEEYLKNK